MTDYRNESPVVGLRLIVELLRALTEDMERKVWELERSEEAREQTWEEWA